MPKYKVGLNFLNNFKCYILNIQRAGMAWSHLQNVRKEMYSLIPCLYIIAYFGHFLCFLCDVLLQLWRAVGIGGIYHHELTPFVEQSPSWERNSSSSSWEVSCIFES